MNGSRVENYARRLSPETVNRVRAASASKTQGRIDTLAGVFADLDAARRRAADIKDSVLANLRPLLLEFEAACRANGIEVHWAADARAARAIVVELCREASPDGGTVAKAKSMATEEIHLNEALVGAGYEPVETDLGEFVVQLDGDVPSHIVTPIIHKDRHQVSRTFVRAGLGEPTSDPEQLTLQARAHLRQKFRQAKIGISGVNFGVAESGRLVLVENEGNSRLSTTAPDVHIAVMGIEKLIPRDADLPLFLRLLAGSATGQKLTVYTHFIVGPRREGEVDGPKRVHLVLLDNGRTRVLNSRYRSILRCIRCGACLNVCPVYRQASGHAYGHVYSGPVGAVLAPAMFGIDKLGDLAKASTLCGSCEEVCPVAIPIPDLLLHLRDEGRHRDGVPWRGFALEGTRPTLWRTGLRMLPLAMRIGTGPWGAVREAPRPEGRSFRRWWDDRS